MRICTPICNVHVCRKTLDTTLLRGRFDSISGRMKLDRCDITVSDSMFTLVRDFAHVEDFTKFFFFSKKEDKEIQLVPSLLHKIHTYIFKSDMNNPRFHF